MDALSTFFSIANTWMACIEEAQYLACPRWNPGLEILGFIKGLLYLELEVVYLHHRSRDEP